MKALSSRFSTAGCPAPEETRLSGERVITRVDSFQPTSPSSPLGRTSPNPWDLSLSGQNVWLYTGDTRTEDKAPQGCDLSADSSAGMATGGFDVEAAPNSKQTRPRLTYRGAKMVLTTESTSDLGMLVLLSAALAILWMYSRSM